MSHQLIIFKTSSLQFDFKDKKSSIAEDWLRVKSKERDTKGDTKWTHREWNSLHTSQTDRLDFITVHNNAVVAPWSRD